jgi:hypothetical protein
MAAAQLVEGRLFCVIEFRWNAGERGRNKRASPTHKKHAAKPALPTQMA